MYTNPYWRDQEKKTWTAPGQLFTKRGCQAFLKMSQKNFNISPDSSGLFATMGIYPLRYNSIIHVMRLFLNKFEEGSPSPWMIHGRDIRLLGLLLWQVHV